MEKSTFNIPKMDCAAEENLIRLQLEEMPAVVQLQFDLNQRELVVFHKGGISTIEQLLDELRLGSKRLKTEAAGDVIIEDTRQQRSVLWIVLLINAAFFFVEMTFGLLANSMGLVADSLDMLADALVYGISLLAVGAAVAKKKQIARLAGYFQMTLAIVGFVEVLRRFFGFAEVPVFQTMIMVSLFALLANGICLYLLQKSKSQEAHMQASMIFTSNDIIINTGVIVAGILVHWTHSSLPDLLIGLIVFLLVMRGARSILQLGKS
ncbi:cation transporter [Phaeodactylibacter sp.]|uniref:cation transporter n=1 Tax=Phaeodactylibacter sp. TaxID=1940289 RepID=UPI0025ED7239|nr:cation transporter [Phaeodactylibacter sp.]MCI5092677.1 cation transporter [Phaeodactylibacter sp.]